MDLAEEGGSHGWGITMAKLALLVRREQRCYVQCGGGICHGLLTAGSRPVIVDVVNVVVVFN